MRLSGEDLRLFTAACSDSENTHAREVMNLLGVDNPADVVRHATVAPLGVLIDLVPHVWRANVHQALAEDVRWGDVLERIA
jgi:hypothetical protein